MKVRKKHGLYLVLAFVPMGIPIIIGIEIFKKLSNKWLPLQTKQYK